MVRKLNDLPNSHSQPAVKLGLRKWQKWDLTQHSFNSPTTFILQFGIFIANKRINNCNNLSALGPIEIEPSQENYKGPQIRFAFFTVFFTKVITAQPWASKLPVQIHIQAFSLLSHTIGLSLSKDITQHNTAAVDLDAGPLHHRNKTPQSLKQLTFHPRQSAEIFHSVLEVALIGLLSKLLLEQIHAFLRRKFSFLLDFCLFFTTLSF